MTLLMFKGLAGMSLHDIGIEDAMSLTWMVEMKVKEVQERMELVRVQMASRMVGASSQVPGVAMGMGMGMGAEAGDGAGVGVGPGQEVGLGPVPMMNEEKPMEVAMEALQRQNWFMDVMNSNDNLMFGGGEEMVPSYIDQANPWIDPCYFPLN